MCLFEPTQSLNYHECGGGIEV